MKPHLSPDVFTLKSSDRNMINGYCGMYFFIQGAQLPGTVIVMDVFTSTLQISPIKKKKKEPFYTPLKTIPSRSSPLSVVQYLEYSTSFIC